MVGSGSHPVLPVLPVLPEDTEIQMVVRQWAWR